MTSSAWSLLALFLVSLLVLSWPLGIWLARICSGNLPGWMHKVESPPIQAGGYFARKIHELGKLRAGLAGF